MLCIQVPGHPGKRVWQHGARHNWRVQPFTSALQRAATASHVDPKWHLLTRLRLIASYAMPAAYYSDVVWVTAFLQPAAAVRNPLQRQLLVHLTSAAGLSATTPLWPLLAELQLCPM